MMNVLTFNKPLFCAVLMSFVLVGCENDDQALNADKAGKAAHDNMTTGESAVSRIQAAEGYTTSGKVNFRQDSDGVRIFGEITGLSPGQHGFHIHEFGDCSAPDGKSAGGHFAPNGNPHGSSQDRVNKRHAGDLGNITADEDGRASIDILDTELTISQGPKAVLGKAVIVHAGSDDMTSQPSGDAGARAGCGVIEDK